MGRANSKDIEFTLVTVDTEIGNELATALEVCRTDIVCGIATRAAQRMTRGPGNAGAPRPMVNGALWLRD